MATSAKKPDPKAKPAGKDAAEAADGEAAPPKKKRGKLVIILVALLLVLGGGGGAAWYFMKGGETGADGKAVAAKPAPAKPPVYVPLEAFTVNLQHEDSSPQYLQVGLSLKVSDPSMADVIKLHMPDIRNRVLLLLSGKKASDLGTPQGKEALSTELIREIGKVLTPAGKAEGVESVLFTSFVVQ